MEQWPVCANDQLCSRTCMWNNMLRYRRRCARNVGISPKQSTCYEYARIHRSYTDECRNDWTEWFAKRVQRCCEAL